MGNRLSALEGLRLEVIAVLLDTVMFACLPYHPARVGHSVAGSAQGALRHCFASDFNP
jgi:hypothetical protein